MRATTLLRKLSRLQPQHTVVVSFAMDAKRGALVLHVKPTTRTMYCGGCLTTCSDGYDHREREWRHTDLGETRVFLRYDIARLDCKHCGPTTELVPWAAHGSWHTYDFEDLVAYKAQGSDQSRVSKDMRISWRTVGKIVQRVVERLLGDASEMLDGLRRIGLDELSFRKHHEYVSIVVDHDRQRVVWAGEGKSGETVDRFFAALGPERAAQIEIVSIDMSAAFIAAVAKNVPKAQIVFDRFHVQKLVHDALDEVRREIVRGLKGTPEGKALKHTRYSLHRSDVNVTPKDEERIATVMATNAPLFRAWMLKALIVSILDEDCEARARSRLKKWLAWASRSRLKPFVKVARTIRKYLDGIMAYIRTGISNGRSEGMNGKVRVLTRRAFGFHAAASLIALLYLCCSGLKLTPRHA